MIAFGIGHSFEEEEELVPIEGGQPAAVQPRGRFFGLRALLPPALLLFYVVAVDRSASS